MTCLQSDILTHLHTYMYTYIYTHIYVFNVNIHRKTTKGNSACSLARLQYTPSSGQLQR